MPRIILILAVILSQFVRAQVGQNLSVSDSLNIYCFPDFIKMDSSTMKRFPFLSIEQNNFRFFTSDSPNWKHFYREFSAMTSNKDRKLNMYHIGGSHLQADIYTHDIRTFLQSNWEDLPGERGLVFPFNLARTNNPANYEFYSPNSWKSYRSVVNRPDNIHYGLTGIAITCSDSIVNILFKHRITSVKPVFNAVRIFHNKGNQSYELNFCNEEILVKEIITDPDHGYTDVLFSDPIDQLDVQFTRTSSEKKPLEIYGFILMNDDPGISYSSIGVNGAGLYTYIENKNFEEQLQLYPPDFFAFSVGTNDANVPYNSFDPQVYKNNLEKMIQKVLRCNPNCAILLTVPNDSYYQKKYLNRNIAREREVIVELAEKYKTAVWDFYGIMGELGSSKTWQKNNLMQADLVHFTGMGYHLKGELFTDAFLKFIQQMEITEKMK